MKSFVLFVCLLIMYSAMGQLPRIHAHNDYEKPQPLVTALEHRAFSIEADVYLINDSLRVVHDEAGAATAPTLWTLYLQPMIALFATHNGTISSDTNYIPILMIDIKKNGEAVLAILQKELAAYPAVFNRTVNAKAVQIIISGDRGSIANWKNYPSFILFDGRPAENYDPVTLEKVGFVSDAYANYTQPADGIDNRIQALATKVHSQGKLLRLWGTPDNAATWKRLLQLGINIINTDTIAACSAYFLQ